MDGGAGFSLLELVVVMALAVTLGAVSVLGHRALRPQLNLSSATQQVVMDLKMARIRAIADHREYRVLFREGSGSYRAQEKWEDGYTDQGGPVSLPAEVVIVDCSARDQAITFAPRGSARTFGTITIRNSLGEVRHVTVNITGHVRVY